MNLFMVGELCRGIVQHDMYLPIRAESAGNSSLEGFRKCRAGRDFRCGAFLQSSLQSQGVERTPSLGFLRCDPSIGNAGLAWNEAQHKITARLAPMADKPDPVARGWASQHVFK